MAYNFVRYQNQYYLFCTTLPIYRLQAIKLPIRGPKILKNELLCVAWYGVGNLVVFGINISTIVQFNGTHRIMWFCQNWNIGFWKGYEPNLAHMPISRHMVLAITQPVLGQLGWNCSLERMRLLSIDWSWEIQAFVLIVLFWFFRSVLAGKCMLPPYAPLLVWVLQTLAKCWPIERTF